jgi:hypothetical protein
VTIPRIPRWWWARALLVVACFSLRAATLPDYIEDRDGLFFSKAVERYSLSEARPHFPGYPVYVWAGKVFALFAPNASDALHALSAVSTSLTVLPLMLLAGAWRRRRGASLLDERISEAIAALLWCVCPVSWLSGTSIFSDPFALLLAFTMFWFCDRVCAGESTRPARDLAVASVLAGLLVGARLSYAPFIVIVAFSAWRLRQQTLRVGWRMRSPLAALVLFAATCGVWLTWQIAIDGGLFFSRGWAHVSGHFGGWGGSVGTDQSLSERPIRFVETLLAHGIGGYFDDESPPLRIAVTVLWALPVALGCWRIARTPKARTLGALFVGPYTVWMALGHDVDLARYFLPIVAVACVVAGVGAWPRAFGVALGLASIAVAGAVSYPLAREYQRSPPPELLLAKDVEVRSGHDVAFVGGEVSPLLLENAPHARVIAVTRETLGRVLAVHRRAGRTIYAVTSELDPLAPLFEHWTLVRVRSISKRVASRGPRRLELRRLD